MWNCSAMFLNRFCASAAPSFHFSAAENAAIFRENIRKIARVRRCARHPIASADFFVVRCISNCAQTCLKPDFCICGVGFSNFRRRKCCNFPRKIRRARAFDVSHPIKPHFEIALVFISSCAACGTVRQCFNIDFARLRR